MTDVYSQQSVPVPDMRRHLPMDVLVVLRWARAHIEAGGGLDGESDQAHWRALCEMCEER